MTRTTTILVTAALLLAQLMMANAEIKLRLNPNVYDAATQSIYVDVEIAYQGSGQLALADQNYRLYFDATTLSLVADQSNSDLPKDQYSPILFHEVLEDIDADGVNQLSFDNNLGFVNFSIDLVNDREGGLAIERKHGWERVAVLKFKMKGDDPSEIVWGRESATNEYATAYVQIMEWKGPNWSEPVDIDIYEDALVDMNKPLATDILFDVSPNPAIDFIRLDFEQPINGGVLKIYSMVGIEVFDLNLDPLIQNVKLPTTDLVPGAYTIEVKDNKTGMIRKESFVKVKK